MALRKPWTKPPDLTPSGNMPLAITAIGILGGPYWPTGKQRVAQGLWIGMDLYVEYAEGM